MALVLIPAWMGFITTETAVEKNQKNIFNRKQQRQYDVRIFIKGKDTLPPLLTDSIRWRRFAISDYQGKRFAIIYNMQNEPDYYTYQADSTKKIITLTDNSDTKRKFYFSYKESYENKLLLRGIWKGRDVAMLLDNVDIDNIPVVKEKITWIRKF